MHMAAMTEQATSKPRPWGRTAALLVALGIVSFILFAFVFQASGDEYAKHPCPTPPVSWQVWATWWLAFGVFATALVCLVIAAAVHWRKRKSITVVCVLGVAFTVLPLAFLADAYGKQADFTNGPKPCSGSSVTGPDS
jgi:cytochrome bd-type quinol oxidase subunit 2